MLTMLTSRPALIAIGVAALLGLVLAGTNGIYSHGFDAGVLHERDAMREAADARQREDQRLANQLAATARAEAASARDTAHRLQMELAHGRPALVSAAGCAPDRVVRLGAAADGGGAARAAGGPEPAASAGQAQLQGGVPDDAGSGLRLTADAVRLWDSATAGMHVPAGACGTADAPAGACSAASAYTIADAWGNHIENAARCRVDRINLQRLIDFLQSRQAPTGREN